MKYENETEHNTVSHTHSVEEERLDGTGNTSGAEELLSSARLHTTVTPDTRCTCCKDLLIS